MRLRRWAMGLLMLTVLVCTESGAWAQARVAPLTTLQNTASTGNGLDLDVEYFNSVALQVAVSATGTVAFEGTVDGSTYAALACTSTASTSGTTVTSATATGIYRCPVAGLIKVRTPISANGGTIIVQARASTASFAGGSGGTVTNLLSCEDETNFLCMVSGGATRTTQILGTGGIPSTATDATSATSILPVGMKVFQGVVTCTGSCVQTQKIYGTYANAATVAASALVCTLTITGTTTASDWCATDRSFNYWFVVTTLTGGTTPLSGIFVQY